MGLTWKTCGCRMTHSLLGCLSSAHDDDNDDNNKNNNNEIIMIKMLLLLIKNIYDQNA